MEKTYVTFGQVHTHRVNNLTFDCDCVAVISCTNEKEGRQRAHDLFGLKFFTTYHEGAFNHDSLEYFPRGLIDVESDNQTRNK